MRYFNNNRELDEIFRLENKDNWLKDVMGCDYTEEDGYICFKTLQEDSAISYDDYAITLDALKNGIQGAFDPGDILISKDGLKKVIVEYVPMLDPRFPKEMWDCTMIEHYGINYCVGYLDPSEDKLISKYPWLEEDAELLNPDEWEKIDSVDISKLEELIIFKSN